jgi:hypothetical protein
MSYCLPAQKKPSDNSAEGLILLERATRFELATHGLGMRELGFVSLSNMRESLKIQGFFSFPFGVC